MSTPTNRTIHIYIDQDRAEASLNKLTTGVDRLQKKIDAGNKAGKDMSKELAELGKKKEAIAQLEGIMSGKMQPTLRMMRNEVRQLKNELQNMSSDAPGYAAKFDRFRQASAHLKEMESRAKGVGNAMQSSSSKFLNNIKSIAIGTLASNAALLGVQSIVAAMVGFVKSNAELSDSLADVEKTTGMTTEEVVKLNSELSRLDTRTKTKELREIAIALGQLGQEATPEAVAAIDKIVVALGDEFGGGANEITKSLSILRNNLQDIKTANYGEDVAHIGNALNVLGAEGLATAPVVTDIANRIAGVGQTFGVTSGQILGVAATFQELGVQEERGATAFIRLLQRMTQNVDEYAKIAEFAGVKSKDFAALVNTDIVAALAKVAEGAKIAGADNVAFGNVLKDLEADGSGAGEVLSKLSQNSELLAQKVTLASSALKETNSITDEFNKKNTNTAAMLEKIGKHLYQAFVNGRIMENISKMVDEFAIWVGVMDRVEANFNELTKQKDKVKELELSLIPLVDRYTELKDKATLNKEEQEELRKVIDEVAKVVPLAATEFDAYGRVIGLNTSFVNDFIKSHKDMLLVMNEELLDDISDKEEYWNRQLKLQEQYLDGWKKGWEEDRKVNGTANAAFFNDEIIRVQNEIEKAKQKINGYRLWRERVLGPESDEPQSTMEINAPAGYNAELARQKGKGNKPATTSYSGDDKKKDHHLQISTLIREFELVQAEVATITADETQKLTAEQEKQLTAVTNKYLALAEKAKEYKITLAGLTEAQEREVTALQAKFFKERSAQEYNLQTKELEKFHAREKEQLLQRLSNNEITQQQYESLRIEMEQDHTRERLTVAEDYAGEAEQAEKDAQGLRTKALQDGIDERNRREKQGNAGVLAALELNILTARKGSKEELQARKAFLQEQFEQETAHMDKSSAEFLVKQEQHNQAMIGLDKDYLKSKVQGYIDTAQQLYNIFSDFLRLQQQASETALRNEVARLDKEKKHYQTLLDEKKISQEVYNKKTEELEEEKRQKEQEHARKAFNQQKAMQIAQIAISTATAIMKAWELGPIAGPIAAAAVGIIGLTQAGIVAGQEFPEYAKGGLLKGASHSEGGINMIDSRTGQKVGEVEGGEPVLSKATYANNKEIIDKLLYSSMYQGGRRLPDWMYSRPAPIRSDMYRPATATTRMFEYGGFVSTATASAPSTKGGYTSGAVAIDSNTLLKFVAAVDRFERMSEKGLKANVYANEIQQKNEQLTAIRDRSRMA